MGHTHSKVPSTETPAPASEVLSRTITHGTEPQPSVPAPTPARTLRRTFLAHIRHPLHHPQHPHPHRRDEEEAAPRAPAAQGEEVRSRMFEELDEWVTNALRDDDRMVSSSSSMPSPTHT
jgi:hypothetical protein